MTAKETIVGPRRARTLQVFSGEAGEAVDAKWNSTSTDRQARQAGRFVAEQGEAGPRRRSPAAVETALAA